MERLGPGDSPYNLEIEKIRILSITGVALSLLEKGDTNMERNKIRVNPVVLGLELEVLIHTYILTSTHRYIQKDIQRLYG